MKNKLILILLIGTLASCSGKKRSAPSEPLKTTEAFFERYEHDGPNEAIKSLLLTNKYFPEQVTDSIAIKLQSLTKELDDYQGYELIRVRTYGKGITLLSYVVKYTKEPLRFNFKFYDPGNGWRIQNFSYETDFLGELDETVKAYRLKENADVVKR